MENETWSNLNYSTPGENDSCRQKYRLVGLNPKTAFSDEQISYYCPLYADLAVIIDIVDSTIGMSMAITGGMGLINYILAYITFSNSSSFEGPSFLYHKAMALLEMVHMAIMCQYGVFRTMQFFGNTFWIAWWRDCVWGGWMIGGSASLAINVLTNFLSLERMIAVWFPLKFDLFNKRKVAIGAIVVSCLIGSLQLSSLFAYHVKLAFGGDYGSEETEFGLSAVYNFILSTINYLKLTMGWITLILCLVVALGMYRSNQKSMKMSNDAKNRWKLVKMGCYLQMILGTTTVIGHCTYVTYKILDQQRPFPAVGRLAMLYVDSFDQVIINLGRAKVKLFVELTNVLALELDHGGRFFFYLVFHSTFRQSFKEIWKGCGKTKVHAILNQKNSP